MTGDSRNLRGAAAAGRENNYRVPRYLRACCIADGHVRESLFGEFKCDRHQAADFCLSDIFRDEIAESTEGRRLHHVHPVLGDDDSRSCCMAGRHVEKDFFGDTVCVLHEEEKFSLSDFFDGGVDRPEGIVCPNASAYFRQAPQARPPPQRSTEAIEQMIKEEAEYSRRTPTDKESVQMLRAASTIQKAWRNPATRAMVRVRRARAYALKQAEVQRRVWASRKIRAAWRLHQYRVAEAAAAEADEAQDAIAAVEAMEAAAEVEAKTTAAGGASAGGELSCAYCSNRPLYENLFGQLVCRLHEELTFSAQYPFADGSGGVDEAEQGLPDSRCPVCDEELSDNRSGRCRTGGKCPFGHAICAACTTQYVKDTLLPRGTVFWDRIKCVKCAAYMSGMSVQRSIDDAELVKAVEARQFDAAYLICGERDPLSQTAVDKHTKPCPGCSAPTEKDGGCDHMTCYICKHQYWYSCDCGYPVHTRGCDGRR